jgi:hypothetical protein
MYLVLTHIETNLKTTILQVVLLVIYGWKMKTNTGWEYMKRHQVQLHFNQQGKNYLHH